MNTISKEFDVVVLGAGPGGLLQLLLLRAAEQRCYWLKRTDTWAEIWPSVFRCWDFLTRTETK